MLKYLMTLYLEVFNLQFFVLTAMLSLNRLKHSFLYLYQLNQK